MRQTALCLALGRSLSEIGSETVLALLEAGADIRIAGTAGRALALAVRRAREEECAVIFARTDLEQLNALSSVRTCLLCIFAAQGPFAG